MIRGIIGRKLGMTQIFDKAGKMIPVTVVEAGPCTILELKTEPKIRVKLGFEPIRESLVNKPKLGYFKKIGLAPVRNVIEFDSTDNKDYVVGQEIKADLFKPGDFVDVTGVSIGKGFQGGMKLHGWKGGKATHGSMHHRRVGSISMNTKPGRVFKGKTMPGHMGDDQVTVQGLRIMEVDSEKNVLLIKGAIPGFSSALININRSKKRTFKPLDVEKVVVVRKINPMKQSKKATGKGK